MKERKIDECFVSEYENQRIYSVEDEGGLSSILEDQQISQNKSDFFSRKLQQTNFSFFLTVSAMKMNFKMLMYLLVSSLHLFDLMQVFAR